MSLSRAPLILTAHRRGQHVVVIAQLLPNDLEEKKNTHKLNSSMAILQQSQAVPMLGLFSLRTIQSIEHFLLVVIQVLSALDR